MGSEILYGAATYLKKKRQVTWVFFFPEFFAPPHPLTYMMKLVCVWQKV